MTFNINQIFKLCHDDVSPLSVQLASSVSVRVALLTGCGQLPTCLDSHSQKNSQYPRVKIECISMKSSLSLNFSSCEHRNKRWRGRTHNIREKIYWKYENISPFSLTLLIAQLFKSITFYVPLSNWIIFVRKFSFSFVLFWCVLWPSTLWERSNWPIFPHQLSPLMFRLVRLQFHFTTQRVLRWCLRENIKYRVEHKFLIFSIRNYFWHANWFLLIISAMLGLSSYWRG